MRVAVLGFGGIGAPVAHALARGEVPGAELAGVVRRDPASGADGLAVLGLDEAVERADLVAECAGQRALAEVGARAVGAGRDLLVVSMGALADDAVFEALVAPAPGRVHLCAGAIGGLDLLAASARMGGFGQVRITTTKAAASLVQPWMDAGLARRLREATEPLELMRGPARKVTRAFPRSANVAAAVAFAARDWDAVEAVVVADPSVERTSHVIEAHGTAGDYRFEIRNRPSERNPASSAVVPFAVLHAIEALAGRTMVFR
ncbi:aspartate dehydrogenase domain-containing protein [Pseudonocardia acaciae]|uniref:aspartate dehydrogenase domain-containing protein n=1 Tax=Pseudonocardia acaciae TaxID=551276 RepID=UPI000565C43A|nr:aspartate dehydrogenase domain-containing protein [Pseudonocardia acaciae]